MTRDVDFEVRIDTDAAITASQTIGRLAPANVSLDTARIPALHAVQQLINDLSHDVRQPMSSINMNLQTALRCLRAPQPRVSAALEALTECLDIERELVRLLTEAQRRVDGDIVSIVQCAPGAGPSSHGAARPEAAPSIANDVISLQARATRCRVVVRRDDGD